MSEIIKKKLKSRTITGSVYVWQLQDYIWQFFMRVHQLNYVSMTNKIHIDILQKLPIHTFFEHLASSLQKSVLIKTPEYTKKTK